MLFVEGFLNGPDDIWSRAATRLSHSGGLCCERRLRFDREMRWRLGWDI